MLTKEEVHNIRERIDISEEIAKAFGILADPGRYKIFRLLIDHKDICVTDVASILGVSLPGASQQLKIMELGGLATKKRTGQTVCYELKESNPLVKSLIKIVTIIK